MKPKLTWMQFIKPAPYIYLNVLNVDRSLYPKLDPLVRAATYFTHSDVGRLGTLLTYFYENAFHEPDFDLTAEYISANPIFSPAQPILNEIFDIWQDCKPLIKQAFDKQIDQTDKRHIGNVSYEEESTGYDWFDSVEYESLKAQYGMRLHQLHETLEKMNDQLKQRISHELIKNPHDYLDIIPLAGVPQKGTATILVEENGIKARLRFVDGFPIGPNIIEYDDDTNRNYCRTIRFDSHRNLMECIEGDELRMIHYPSMRSIELIYDDGQLDILDAAIAFDSMASYREYYYADEDPVLQIGEDIPRI